MKTARHIALATAVTVAAPLHAAKPRKTPPATCAEQDARIIELEAENAALKEKLGEAPSAAPGASPAPAPVPPPEEQAPEIKADSGFGGIPWGASVKALKKKHPRVTAGPDGHTWILPDQSIAGLDALVAYVFIDDKFVVALVLFTETYVNDNKYLDAHEQIRELITSKYGTPKTSSKDYWDDDLYQDDYNKWGMAVATGRLTRISSWSTPTTDIELVTKGENFKITNKVRYASTAHKDLFESFQLKRKTDGL